MSDPDFETLSIEEIEAWKLERKLEMQAIRARAVAANEVHKAKLALKNLAQKLGVPVDGLTAEQAQALLVLANAKPRSGDVTVTPDPAVLTAEGVQ